MKNFLSFTEAVARAGKRSKADSAADFRDRWSSLMSGLRDASRSDVQASRAVSAPWLLTGHKGGRFTSGEVDRMRERVFGKIGESEILFYTDRGIVTLPAEANATHSDIEALPTDKPNSWGYPLEKLRQIASSVVWGRGRVQHGEVGIISFHARPEHRRHLSGMVRSLERAYPGYQIHDGKGNLLEAVKAAKKPKEKAKITDFKAKFRQIRNALGRRYDDPTKSVAMMGSGTAIAGDAANNPWVLTGHQGSAYTTTEIETMKRKVFGSGSERSELFFWIQGHGMLSFPAAGGAIHDEHLDDVVKKWGKDRIRGYGRIEHHDGGRGIISFHTKVASDLPPAVRSLRRQYPKYVIHDGFGNEYLDESYRTTKDGWQHSRGIGGRRWMSGTHIVQRQRDGRWTVYDWVVGKELYSAKTAKAAKAWANGNRSATPTVAEPITIKPWNTR